MTVWIVSAILIITLYLLITEKVPVDVTAIGIMVVLMISHVLTPVEAVAGFAHPAVITVGSMFLVSKGMVRTGAVGYIGQKVIEIARGNAKLNTFNNLVEVDVTRNNLVGRTGYPDKRLRQFSVGIPHSLEQ